MPKISIEEINNLANMARLSLVDAEVEQLQNELGAILEYVNKIQEVDTSRVAPYSDVRETPYTSRDDVADHFAVLEGLLPPVSMEENLFSTKAVFDRDDT